MKKIVIKIVCIKCEACEEKLCEDCPVECQECDHVQCDGKAIDPFGMWEQIRMPSGKLCA